MATGTYERASGSHVAERIRPAAGTSEEAELAELAADPATDWRFVPDESEQVKEPADPSVRPPQSAPVADWRAWAVTQGLTEAEAEAASKAALIERFAKGGDA